MWESKLMNNTVFGLKKELRWQTQIHRFKDIQMGYFGKEIQMPCRKKHSLTAEAASYYRGKLYEARKLSHGGDRKSKGKNYPLIRASEEISREYGVAEKTVSLLFCTGFW